MYIIFGNFKKKYEQDLKFLQSYFPEFLPPTRIIDFNDTWAVQQQRIDGRFFFDSPQMKVQARILFSRANEIYRSTGKIPDLSNPGNLLCEHETDRLFLVDISVLGTKKWWPIGFWVTRLLGKILFDTIQSWLKSGF